MASDELVRIAEAVQYMLDYGGRDYERFVERRDDGSVYAVDFHRMADSVPYQSEERLQLRCARAIWGATAGVVDPFLLPDLLLEAPRQLFRRWIGAQSIASGYFTREMVEAMTVVELAAGGLEES